MNTIVNIKIFNDILEQFFDFLEVNFEIYKSDIVLTRTAISFVRNGNPRLVAEKFMESVKPYKEQLFDCNDNFFLDYEKNIELNGLQNDDIVLIKKIKDLWLSPNITENQKAYIWLYLQKLYKAGQKICKK
jgi:hypothetical protein